MTPAGKGISSGAAAGGVEVNGAQVSQGSGAPNNANGANGDIYLRTDGSSLGTFYEKQAGVWVPLKTIADGTVAGGVSAPGMRVIAGTGAPVNANGTDGDFYLRSDGGAGTTIYQRRAGAWVGLV